MINITSSKFYTLRSFLKIIFSRLFFHFFYIIIFFIKFLGMQCMTCIHGEYAPAKQMFLQDSIDLKIEMFLLLSLSKLKTKTDSAV